MATTTTQALKVTCNELYDLDVLNKLLKSVGVVDPDTLKNLKYLRYNKLKGASGLDVTYMHKSGYHRKSQVGRMYPQNVKFCMAQGMPRALRNTLANKHYWDVDMVNAQPNLCVRMCKQNDWKCEVLEDYVECREHWLAEVSSYYGVSRKDAKQMIQSLCFGGTMEAWQAKAEVDLDDFVPMEKHLPVLVRLSEEMRAIGAKVICQFPEMAAGIKKENPKAWWGTFVAHLLQDIERQALQLVMESLEANGRRMDVLMHDGGYVRKLPGEEEFPEELLREAEEHVANTCPGLEIRLVVKPMEEVLQLESKVVVAAEGGARSDPVYVQWKEEREQEWVFIQQPPTYVRVHADGTPTYMCNAAKFEQSFEHSPKVGDGPAKVSCHKLWMTDPAKRCFERMVFRPPPLVAKPNEFNLWSGFAVERIEPSDKGSAQPMIDHLKMLLGDAFDYHIKWMAYKVQQPGKLNRVALVWAGAPGAGKNIPVVFLQYIFGDNMFFKTSNPQTTVFGRFNGALMNKLLVNIDEGDKEKLSMGREQLKDLIANKTISVEKKGIDVFTIENFAAFLFTTNHLDAVPIDSLDRRYVAQLCNDLMANNYEYFEKLAEYIEQPENQRAFYDYLMSVDVAGVDWINERPNGQLYNHMKAEAADDFSKYWMSLYSKFEAGSVWAGEEEMAFQDADEFMKNYIRFEKEVLELPKPTVTNTKQWGRKLSINKLIRKGDEQPTARLEFVAWEYVPGRGNSKMYTVSKDVLGQWLMKKGLLDKSELIDYSFTE